MMPVRNNNQNWFPSIFNDFFDNDCVAKVNTATSAVNVIEDDKCFKVEVAAPGMTKEDFSINLNENDELVISMEKKNRNEEKDDKKKYLRREFSYSKFQQSLVLPDNVEKDKISATVNDGVLAITLPKMTNDERAKLNRAIEIQ